MKTELGCSLLITVCGLIYGSDWAGMFGYAEVFHLHSSVFLCSWLTVHLNYVAFEITVTIIIIITIVIAVMLLC